MTRSGQLEMTFGMERAIERASEWAERAQRRLRDLSAGVEFTAEDLRNIAGDPPGHGDSIGAVLRNARAAGLIRAVGHTASTRPERHGAQLVCWERTTA